MGQYMQYANMAMNAMGNKGGDKGGGGGGMLGGMLGGGGDGQEESDELAPKKSSGGFQDSAESMDQLGQAFSNIADSEFAATEEYRKQRGQGLPETHKPQLQNVQSGVSKLAGLFSPDEAPSEDMEMDMPAMDTTPVEPEEDEESKMARMNALKGLFS